MEYALETNLPNKTLHTIYDQPERSNIMTISNFNLNLSRTLGHRCVCFTFYKMNITHLIYLSPLLLLSCGDSKPKPTTTDDSSVTTQELLATLGGFSCRVQINDEIKDGQSCGLAQKFSDGSINPMSLSTGFKKGDLVKYVCIHPENGIFKFSYTSQSKGGAGSSANFPKFISTSSSLNHGTIVKPGDSIARYSVDGIMGSQDSELSGDDFDLIFYIHPLEN